MSATEKTSAGPILMYRRCGTELQVLLVHPAGPFWARKDKGAWSIPKGECAEGEDPLAAARREVAEELGLEIAGAPIELDPVRQSGGKVVHAWAVESDFDLSTLHSNVSGWTTETLESLKEDAREKHILVAEDERAIVGSVRFWTVAGVCVIRLLSVHPTHQRRGAGKALIDEIERATTDAHKFYACTMLRTPRNVQFFLNLGYKAETILPDHYDHLDLICFAKYR